MTTCSIRHVGGVAEHRTVLRRPGAVVCVPVKRVAGLQIRVDIQRNERVVTTGDRQRGPAVVIGSWNIGQTIEGGVDVRNRAQKGDGGICGPVARRERQARGAEQTQAAVRNGERHLKVPPLESGSAVTEIWFPLPEEKTRFVSSLVLSWSAPAPC